MAYKISIYGAGGFGFEVAMLIEQINNIYSNWDFIGFFDDNVRKGNVLNGYPVLGGIQELNAWKDNLYLVLAIGIPKIKKKVYSKIENKNIKYPTLIHPSVIMGEGKYLTIGEGCIICAGNIITTNITIDDHVILNLACTVGHDAVIGKFSSFMPSCNISGEVTIGESVYCGTGAKISNKINVGNNVVVGAGSVLVDNIPDNVTAVGVPAKIKK